MDGSIRKKSTGNAGAFFYISIQKHKKMISILSANTYYFPKAEVIDKASFVLSLYSDLSKTNKDFQVSTNPGVSSSKYYPIVITQELIDDMNAGEYNYTLKDGDLVASKGLLRIIKEDTGEYDPETDYVIWGEDVDWITTDMVNSDALWQSGYTSGYTDGAQGAWDIPYASGYTDGYASGYTYALPIGYNSGWTAGYGSGSTDGYDSGLTIGYNSGYTSGYNSGSTDGFESGWTNGYSSGYTDGYNAGGGWDDGYESGYTDGFGIGYQSGNTDGQEIGYESGYTQGYSSGTTDGFNTGYASGTTDGKEIGYQSGWTGGYDSGATDGFEIGYQSGTTDGFETGYSSGRTDGYDAGIEDGYGEGYRDGQYHGRLIGYQSGFTAGYSSGSTDGYNSGLTIGYNSGWTGGYSSGLTDGFASGYLSGATDGFDSGWTGGYNTGYDDGQMVMYDYLWMKALTNNANVSLRKISGSDLGNRSIEYSFNKLEWSELTSDTVNVESGQTVYFRGNNPSGTGVSSLAYLNFGTSGIFDCGGDITSLVNEKGGITSMSGTSWAFGGLFYQANIINAPDLSMDETGEYQYAMTFSECNYLTKTPKMKINADGNHTFVATFGNCASLVEATIDSPILSGGSLYNMFNGCSSLSSVTSYLTNTMTLADLGAWMSGVKQSGDFYNIGGAYFGNGRIPLGWTEHKMDVQTIINYSGLVFTALEDNCSVGVSANYTPQLYKSANGTNWNSWDYSSVNLNAGDKLYVKGLLLDGTGHTHHFNITGNVNVQGNAMSVIDNGACSATTVGERQFAGLFSGNTGLEISGLTLPATSVRANACYGMFSGCTSISIAPELPATTIDNSCYSHMFEGCTSLQYSPSTLPAMQLSSSTYDARSCYGFMFKDCTSLITAPTLPATALTNNCYYGMFQHCTSLSQAPVLPATTLKYSCYYTIFYDTQINKVITYAQDISAGNCLLNWLGGTPAEGDFYNLGGANYPSGASGIPNGWTVHTQLDT